MKIVAFSTYYSRGGAGKAAFKFCKLLVESGADLSLYTSQQVKSDQNYSWVHYLRTSNSNTWKLIDSVMRRVLCLKGLGLYSSGLIGRVDKQAMKSVVADADVILLFWVNDGFISISDIRYISRKSVPIYWRLSDQWPLSNGLHYIEPAAVSRLPSISRFALNILDRFKQNSLTSNNIHYIAPSQWIYKLACRRIGGDERVVYLPTTVDLVQFTPDKRLRGRLRYNFDDKSLYILYGAESSTTDPRKGYDLLRTALAKLPTSYLDKSIKLVIFGGKGSFEKGALPVEVITLGRLDFSLDLPFLYAACDVFVAPARMENLANTCLEAIASGLPVISFDVGGMPDVIENNVNGFLTRPYDCTQFGLNILTVLGEHERFSIAARQIAEQKFCDSMAILKLQEVNLING